MNTRDRQPPNGYQTIRDNKKAPPDETGEAFCLRDCTKYTQHVGRIKKDEVILYYIMYYEFFQISGCFFLCVRTYSWTAKLMTLLTLRCSCSAIFSSSAFMSSGSLTEKATVLISVLFILLLPSGIILQISVNIAIDSKHK